jgi:elongation factor 2
LPRRSKEIIEILKLMHKVEKIRNIGLVGHIDHGKTTLSDSLLSEAGLLSPDLAGEARVLDYLEEEQRRGITMKSTNISLYYEKSLGRNEEFLINLVDTPGHLDFSGKVTRALRLIDGVVVIVDAVEEIISQSETVIKQALQEGVKPVLYINKLDRLFRELKLKPDQIRKKITRIINDFNKLIERFADPEFKEEWKVSPAAGTIAFGSALHKWGFTLSIFEKNNISFEELRNRYLNNDYEILSVLYPIHQAILEMVVDHLPNPKEAQKYRIKKIWEGDISLDTGKSMIECNSDGPLIICLSKVIHDKGRLIGTGRIFSGTLKAKTPVFLLRENNEQIIQSIAIFMGARRDQVEEIPVGNIAAIGGLKNIKSGETLIDTNFLNQMIAFENVKYVTTPVITISVEPNYLRDLEPLKDIIKNLLIEDPNLQFNESPETGELLLSGMGPLHLEVTINEIKKRGIEVEMSKPRSVFKESCLSYSSSISTNSPNEKNSIQLKIERLDLKTLQLFRSGMHRIVKPLDKLKQLLSEKTSLKLKEIEGFLDCDEKLNILIYNPNDDKEITLDEKNKIKIIDLVNKICLNGPLCSEVLTEVKIIIENLQISSKEEESSISELTTMIYDAIKQGLNEAQLVLLEPIYQTTLQLPPELMKKALSLLAKYQLKVNNINQDNEYQTLIEFFMPVRYAIDFAEDIRNKTSGRAFWQNIFHSFQPVPKDLMDSIISDIKFRKGISW